ncbi:B12-binding domain-containing radical SAM protein [Candidatus Margulisiibacteriota bacterium]
MATDVTLVNLNVFRPILTPKWPMFIKRFFLKKNIPWPTGALYIAAALERSGLRVDFRDYQLNKYTKPFDPVNMTEFIAKDSADLICISCTSSFLPYAVLVCSKLKILFPYKIIVLGGIGPSGVPTELIETFPFIDIVVIGEGEKTIVQISQALKNRKPMDTVKGIAFRNEKQEAVCTPGQERIRNLDELPLPAYHLTDLRKYNNGGISIGRGCPFGCTFCNLVGMWKQQVFYRSNDLILQEIEYLKKAGKRIVSFVDDTFILDKERTIDLCQKLIQAKLKINYVCQARVDLLDNELLQILKASGCKEIFFGVESGSNTVLAKIKKQFTIEIAINTIEKVLAEGIAVTASFIWGFPFETKDDFLKTLLAVRKLKKMGAKIAFSILTPLPLSPIYQEYKDHLIFPDDGPNFVSGMLGQDWQSDREIEQLVKKYPKLFSSFYYYDSPALQEKINLIKMSLAYKGLHYATDI